MILKRKKMNNTSPFLVYLQESRSFSEDRVIVMGNQACDLDSLVSAISLAYYEHGKNKVNAVGLIPIKKSEIPLRSEITYLFNLLHLSDNLLLTVEDVDLKVSHYFQFSLFRF